MHIQGQSDHGVDFILEYSSLDSGMILESLWNNFSFSGSFFTCKEEGKGPKMSIIIIINIRQHFEKLFHCGALCITPHRSPELKTQAFTVFSII